MKVLGGKPMWHSTLSTRVCVCVCACVFLFVLEEENDILRNTTSLLRELASLRAVHILDGFWAKYIELTKLYCRVARPVY